MIHEFKRRVLDNAPGGATQDERAIASLIVAAAQNGIVSILGEDSEGYWSFSFPTVGTTYELCFYKNPSLTSHPRAERAVRASDFIMTLLDAISHGYSYHIVSLKHLSDPLCTDEGRRDSTEATWVANDRPPLFERLFADAGVTLTLLTDEKKEALGISDKDLPVLTDEDSGHELDLTLYLTSGSVFRRVSACVRIIERSRKKTEGEPDEVTIDFEYYDSKKRNAVASTSGADLDEDAKRKAKPILDIVNDLSAAHKRDIINALVLGERTRLLSSVEKQLPHTLLSDQELERLTAAAGDDAFPILGFLGNVANAGGTEDTERIGIVTMIPSALFIDAIPPVYTYAIGEELGESRDRFFSLLWNETTLPKVSDTYFYIKRDAKGELIGLHGTRTERHGTEDELLPADARILLEDAYIGKDGLYVACGNAIVERSPRKCHRCGGSIFVEYGTPKSAVDKAKLLDAAGDEHKRELFCHHCIESAVKKKNGTLTSSGDADTYLFPYAPKGSDKENALIHERALPKALYTCAGCGLTRYAKSIDDVDRCLDCGKLFCEACRDKALSDGDCAECSALHESLRQFLEARGMLSRCLARIGLPADTEVKVKLLTYDTEAKGKDIKDFTAAYFTLTPKAGKRTYRFILKKDTITLEGIE